MSQARHFDLAFQLPEGWADRTSVLFVGPARDGYAPTVVVVRKTLPAATTSREFAAGELPGLRETAGGEAFHLIREGDIVIATREAFRRVYECVYPAIGGNLTQMQVYIVIGREATTITATAPSDRYEATEPVFIQMIAGMKFTEAQPR